MYQRIKNNILALAAGVSLSPNAVVFLIMGIASTAFSIKTLDLGFFNDDWHHIYYAYLNGVEGLRQFLFFDSRPLAFIIYAPLFELFGFNALIWHLAVLILRLVAILLFWMLLNMIWPDNRKENGLVAALFLIYPVYQLQPVAVAYTMHWLLYSVFMFSLVAMVLSVHRRRFFVFFTVVSLLLQLFHLLIFEYFAGIELIRPLLLWYALRELPLKERAKKVAVYWIPYLILLAVYAVFRASFSETLGYDRNTPVVLLGLFSTPLTSIAFLVQSAITDLVDVLLVTWNDTYKPASINFSVFSNVWIWGIAAVTGILSWVYFWFVREKDDSRQDPQAWGRAFLVLGLLFIILGFLPAWITGRTFFQTYDALDDRLALPCLFGASMVWIGGLFTLVQKNSHRYMLACTLLGLAVGLQLRTNNVYAAAWRKQSQFYWQLYWRAPYIEPQTAFVADGEFLSLMGRHPTSYAINLMYPQENRINVFNYALFVSGEEIGGGWEEFQQGVALDDSRFGSTFQGSSNNSLTILFLPENKQCLWILRPEDKRIRNMPDLTYESMPMSNLDRISRDKAPGEYPPAEIFGAEPARTWCYYYQKADLARQYQDWSEITRLWQEARLNGFLPDHPAEYMVFIEAFAQLKDWDQAVNLTNISSKLGDNIRPALCEFWNDLENVTPAAVERENASRKIDDKLGCYQ